MMFGDLLAMSEGRRLCPSPVHETKYSSDIISDNDRKDEIAER